MQVNKKKNENEKTSMRRRLRSRGVDPSQVKGEMIKCVLDLPLHLLLSLC